MKADGKTYHCRLKHNRVLYLIVLWFMQEVQSYVLKDNFAVSMKIEHRPQKRSPLISKTIF